MTRILGIAGSLRGRSHNAALLDAAGRLLPPDAHLVVWAGLRDLPPYDEDADRDDAPAAVAALRDAIASADSLLVATPEYNGSIPGPLKNAIDWASRPYPENALRRKPAAVVGASTGPFGAVWAQADLRRVLRAAGADVAEHELAVAYAGLAFAADGSLADPSTEAALRALLLGLVRMGARRGRIRAERKRAGERGCGPRAHPALLGSEGCGPPRSVVHVSGPRAPGAMPCSSEVAERTTEKTIGQPPVAGR